MFNFGIINLGLKRNKAIVVFSNGAICNFYRNAALGTAWAR